MNLIRLPLADLTPADYNPRRPLTAKAHAKLRASLEAFGLVEPLIWNRASGRLVGGHARLTLLKELGHDDAPVSVVDLTDAQEKALNVVLNNREAQGRFDPIKLADLLGELEPLPELALSGFDAADLPALRLEPLPPTPTPDEPPQVEVTLTFTEPDYEAAANQLDNWARAGTEVRVTRRG